MLITNGVLMERPTHGGGDLGMERPGKKLPGKARVKPLRVGRRVRGPLNTGGNVTSGRLGDDLGKE